MAHHPHSGASLIVFTHPLYNSVSHPGPRTCHRRRKGSLKKYPFVVFGFRGQASLTESPLISCITRQRNCLNFQGLLSASCIFWLKSSGSAWLVSKPSRNHLPLFELAS